MPVAISDEEILKSFEFADSHDLNSEERVILSSVHELMDALDIQRKAMIAKLRAAKVSLNVYSPQQEFSARLRFRSSGLRMRDWLRIRSISHSIEIHKGMGNSKGCRVSRK